MRLRQTDFPHEHRYIDTWVLPMTGAYPFGVIYSGFTVETVNYRTEVIESGRCVDTEEKKLKVDSWVLAR